MDDRIALELDEIAEMLERLERGQWSYAAFRARSPHYGVFSQSRADRFFVRVRVPLGIMSAPQLEAVAAALCARSHDRCHLTVRQGLEVHNLNQAQVLPLLTALAESGLSSHETGGNSLRSIVVCPHAGVGIRELFDPSPSAALLSQYFLRHPDTQSLPRETKIGFSCCDDDCARTLVQDLGFQARTGVQGEHGFRVLAGGGTGASPLLAEELIPFIPVSQVPFVTEAFLRLIDRLGDRKNPLRARSKFLVQRLGVDRIRQELRREMDGLEREGRTYPTLPEIDHERREPGTIPDDEPVGPARTVPADVAPWIERQTEPQAQPGYSTVRVHCPGGWMTSAAMRAVARIMDQFNLAVRLTPDQGLLLRWARTADLVGIYDLLAESRLLAAPTFLHAMACPAFETCSNAFTDAPGMAAAIAARLAGTAAGAALGEMSVRVSGCSNGCALHATAEVGLEGLARRCGTDESPAYRIWLGGREHDRRPSLAHEVGVVSAGWAPGCLRALADGYLEQRYAGESLPDLLGRVGVGAFRAIVNRFNSDHPASAI